MAEVGHWVAEFEKRMSAATVGLAALSGHEIVAANLDASANYIYIIQDLLMGSSTSVNDFQFRLDGAGIASGSETLMRYEPRNTSSIIGHHYFYIEKVLTPTVSTDLEGQGGNVSTAAVTMRAIAWHGMAIKLDDLASADYAYSRSTNTFGLNNSFWRAGASVIIGDGTSDYAVFIHTQGSANASGVRLRWRLEMAGAAEGLFNELESEDSRDEYQVGSFLYVPNPGTSITAQVAFQTNSSTANQWSSHRSTIFALRLNAFEQYFAKRGSATVSVAAADTEYTSVSNPFLTGATAARKWFVGCSHVMDSNSNFEQWHRYLYNGASRIAGEGSDVASGMKELQNGADRPVCLLMQEIATTTASTSINLYAVFESEARTDGQMIESHLLAWTWEKAAVVIDRTVAASAQALIITENALTANRTRTLATVTQALAFVEQAAAVVPGLQIAATAQALAITEAAVTVNRERGLDATAQALAFTQNQAVISFALDRVVQATSQALAISEFAATITGVPRTVATAVQALAVAQYAATISTAPAWTLTGDAGDDWSAVGNASANWTLVVDQSSTWA